MQIKPCSICMLNSAARANAYRLESDPLKTEAEFDAIKGGTEPDYSLWLAKVEEIKERYPLPEEPK